MNTTLKHWKEAATLILVAGTQHGNIQKVQDLPQKILWRNLKKSSFDYEILLLKRSQKSGFMPNAFVFPGGLVEPSDFSNDWIKVFDSYKNKPNFGLGLVKQHHSSRSPMFLTDRSEFGSQIPGEVAFRICAIRETFEESGILLVVPENTKPEESQTLMEACNSDEEILNKWRLEVQKNPFKFIQLCEEMRCLPNIWALHEWGNWLTPVLSNNSKGRRYDTAFFICCLSKKPTTSDDQKEVSLFKWWTPPDALEQDQSLKVWIPPPQFYEISKLCNLASLDVLHRFSRDRALQGCERWMPVLVHAEDGMVHTLPGDDLYPEDPDCTGNRPLLTTDKKVQDLTKKGGNFNRLLIQDGVPTLQVNSKPKYKHFNPVVIDTYHSKEPKSKL
ncbi:acyl-coenzyme A diphosphatase NUDT19 [Bombina bombina]|uniref:acyl-coenzyme A diphosphatase NUDT19 n=1 Tax=Bombina bombina TaxID=8345 RepID=UPI00235AC2D8|nr:acyl-coenzyme A diphosphatase NUDT19 [Bombina bombina]XP_053557638.1 acyl-coenzyme A diphosphatase NUDT19 [Bombina bombina]